MGNLTNNKIRTYYIYGSSYEHDGLSNLAMCIRLSKATKLCQMPMLINLILKEKMRTNSQGVKCIFLVEPGKWVQSFFLNVFMLYRYCTP